MSSTCQEVYSSNPEDFELIEPIGFGSSATVFLAIYKPKNIRVAVKVIDMDMFERNQIDELRRETQVMFLCKHPNLLPVYCSYVLGSKLHIVTPYLAAGSCLEILKYSHPEGLEEIYIASILKQALLGLEYLHKNGHIHRDIKAGNLLVDEQGSVLLADFGVSSSLNDYGERNKLRKTFVGTPCWMAPEVMEQAGYDHRADVWSFGITALELATGQAPLAKFPPIKVLMMTLSKEPPTLERDQTKNKYSKAFKEMIDSCLSKDPSKRPSVDKLLQHSFFKQTRKVSSIATLIQQLPPIEKRIGKNKTPQTIKLPTTSESWNFTPSNEHFDQDSYFNIPTETVAEKLSSDKSTPEVQETLNNEPNRTVSFTESTISEKESLKKGRFVVDTPNPVRSDSTSSAGVNSSEVRKGRFSVSERNDTPVTSPILQEELIESVGQLPLTREASKSSRFSVSSETGNISPVEGIGLVLQASSSFSKRGRFQVSNQNGETKDEPANTSDHSNTLMMYANQLDSITKQNEAQRQVIEDLHLALTSGKISNSQQPSSISKSLAEQTKANSKIDDILSDTMSLIQQILVENGKLKQENEELRCLLDKSNTLGQTSNEDNTESSNGLN